MIGTPASISARFINRPRHDPEDLGARFFGAEGRFGHDFVADARQFQIELESGDAGFRPANFVIHVSEMILGADDVGEQFVTFQIAAVAEFGDEADTDSGDRSLDWHAGIHQREHSSAHTGHRARAV